MKLLLHLGKTPVTTSSLELNLTLCCKWRNYYLQLIMNKMPIETKLFIILFQLAQLVKFLLALI